MTLALYWKAVEYDPNYSTGVASGKVMNALSVLYKKHITGTIDNIISFGPGAGSLDKEVLPVLSSIGTTKYIPVDLNYYLLNLVSDNIERSNTNIIVPYAIHGDFEDGMAEITKKINLKTLGNRIFLMLGSTFANIEIQETTFFSGLKGIMRKGDYLFLETFLKRDQYTQPNQSEVLPIQPDSLRELISYAIHRKKNISKNYAYDNLDDLVAVGNINSHVKDTSGFSLKLLKCGTSLLYVRHYKEDSLINFIKNNIGLKIYDIKRVDTKYSNIDRAFFLISA